MGYPGSSTGATIPVCLYACVLHAGTVTIDQIGDDLDLSRQRMPMYECSSIVGRSLGRLTENTYTARSPTHHNTQRR